jgi:hypothetical protein
MLLKPVKPITRKIVMYVTGEETLDDLFRFTVAHQEHIKLRKIKGHLLRVNLEPEQCIGLKKRMRNLMIR